MRVKVPEQPAAPSMARRPGLLQLVGAALTLSLTGLIDVDSGARIYERRLNQPIGTGALDEVLTDMITLTSRDAAGSGGALLRSSSALQDQNDLRCLALADRFLNASTLDAFGTAHACLTARPQHVQNDARPAPLAPEGLPRTSPCAIPRAHRFGPFWATSCTSTENTPAQRLHTGAHFRSIRPKSSPIRPGPQDRPRY